MWVAEKGTTKTKAFKCQLNFHLQWIIYKYACTYVYVCVLWVYLLEHCPTLWQINASPLKLSKQMHVYLLPTYMYAYIGDVLIVVLDIAFGVSTNTAPPSAVNSIFLCISARLRLFYFLYYIIPLKCA